MTEILLVIIIIELAAIWLQYGRIGKLLNEWIERKLIERAKKRK
jgi:hypothetical protein